jgi:hypothetical protein
LADQVFCRAHQRWVDVEDWIVIPPDVQAIKTNCGHNLPLNSEIREDPDPKPMKKKPTPPPAPSADEQGNDWDNE